MHLRYEHFPLRSPKAWSRGLGAFLIVCHDVVLGCGITVCICPEMSKSTSALRCDKFVIPAYCIGKRPDISSIRKFFLLALRASDNTDHLDAISDSIHT